MGISHNEGCGPSWEERVIVHNNNNNINQTIKRDMPFRVREGTFHNPARDFPPLPPKEKKT